ncbi:hypothetical protein WH96_20935, partial [Kiloniella spongiae]
STHLYKLSGGTSWNAGAYSVERFTGSGSLTFEATETNTARMVGLSVSGGSSDYTNIDFAIYQAADGLVEVIESGTNKGKFGSYSTGDQFSIERTDSGSIVYSKNGEVFYTSAKTSSLDTSLLADASL